MPRKPKKPQAEDLEQSNGRDLFQTPNYATELLVPYIPDYITHVWECAAGHRKIASVLANQGFKVLATDIGNYERVTPSNFLTDPNRTDVYRPINAIITNPPFSLKRRFYQKCLEYNLPFALLLPFDMCHWMAEAFKNDGVQALVPNRRIDYITPTGLSGANGHTAYYHSFWLTWGFNLPSQMTVVELSNEMKENI